MSEKEPLKWEMKIFVIAGDIASGLTTEIRFFLNSDQFELTDKKTHFQATYKKN